MDKLEKIEKTLLSLLIILLPSQLAKHFWPPHAFVSGIRIDYLSPTIFLNDLIIFILLAISIFKFTQKTKKNKAGSIYDKLRKPKGKKPILLALAGIFITLNILFATRPVVVFITWFRALEMVFLFIYLKNSPIFTMNKLTKLLPIPLLYSALLTVAQVVKQASIGGLFYWLGERSFSLTTPGVARTAIAGKVYLRPYASFPHPNALAGFFLVSLLLILFFKPKYKTNTSRQRRVKIALSILIIPMLILTLSQAVWVAAMIAGFLYIAKTKTKTAWLAAPILILVVLGVISSSEKQSIIQRTTIFKESLAAVSQNPVVGVGLGNFIPAVYEGKKISSQFTSSMQFYQPVHNIFLLTAVETGVVGELLLLIFLLRALKKTEDDKKTSLQLSLIAITTTGMLDHYWLTLYQNRLLFVMILALIWRKKS